jgi:hypothetical protein
MEKIFPQANYERMILGAPICRMGMDVDAENIEQSLIDKLDSRHVMMMGDNPDLPSMPENPGLLDFFKYRFERITSNHLLASAKHAMDQGEDEKIVMAIMLHDISNACLIRSDHGYWGAQLIAPYVSEEIAWAVKYHQALRFYADEEAGYPYPESYNRFFGPDYTPPDYIRQDAEYAKNHEWYISARLVTIYDKYFFDDDPEVDPDIFTDIVARNFKQPEQGLGFDNSSSAHMWRTIIWPNNFL